MSKIYCLDTNIIIEILRDNDMVINWLNKTVKKDDLFAIPSIVYYEIMRGFHSSGATKREKQFTSLYEGDNVLHLPLDDKAIGQAISIYTDLPKGITVDDIDIFIAAIAITNDCILITNNVKHFIRIRGLSIMNWRESQCAKN